jgi:hypothetical protein
MVQEQNQVDYVQAFNEIANRIRVLEGRGSLFSEKLLVMNQNMISEYEKTLLEIKKIRSEIIDLREDILKVKNVVKHFSEEASKFARQDDVKVLQKYVNYWNPLNFVTEKEVESIVINVLGKHKVKGKEVKTIIEESITETRDDSVLGALKLLRPEPEERNDAE